MSASQDFMLNWHNTVFREVQERIKWKWERCLWSIKNNINSWWQNLIPTKLLLKKSKTKKWIYVILWKVSLFNIPIVFGTWWNNENVGFENLCYMCNVYSTCILIGFRKPCVGSIQLSQCKNAPGISEILKKDLMIFNGTVYNGALKLLLGFEVKCRLYLNNHKV